MTAENLHVFSKLSASERTQKMREFVAYQSALMINARCLTEGVDVPSIDCVLFAEPQPKRGRYRPGSGTRTKQSFEPLRLLRRTGTAVTFELGKLRPNGLQFAE